MKNHYDTFILRINRNRFDSTPMTRCLRKSLFHEIFDGCPFTQRNLARAPRSLSFRAFHVRFATGGRRGGGHRVIREDVHLRGRGILLRFCRFPASRISLRRAYTASPALSVKRDPPKATNRFVLTFEPRATSIHLSHVFASCSPIPPGSLHVSTRISTGERLTSPARSR